MHVSRKDKRRRRVVNLPSYAKNWQPKEIVKVECHPNGAYPAWPLEGQGGRADKSLGEFSLRVAREHFRREGYTVLASEPRLPNNEGFILLSYPRKRERRDAAYEQMVDIFGRDTLELLNAVADAVKIHYTGNRSGGDPDLFVFKGDGKKVRFFVEAKYKDSLIAKQRLCFPLIKKFLHCEVKGAQLHRNRELNQRR